MRRKAQRQIILDDSCRVWRADGAATFEISVSKKTYYLTADSSATVEEWVRILQNVVRRNTTRILLGRVEDQKPTLEGWLVKVKHGHSKRCWCILVGKTFLYFKSPTDQVPNPTQNPKKNIIIQLTIQPEPELEPENVMNHVLMMDVCCVPTLGAVGSNQHARLPRGRAGTRFRLGQ